MKRGINRLILLLTTLILSASGQLFANPPGPDSINSGLSIAPGPGADTFLISWWGLDDYYYFVEFSEDLRSWNFVPEVWTGLDAVLSLGYSSTADRLFFRTLASNDPESSLLANDYNNIGLSAWEQIQFGYNPFEWVDVDENGLHDAWEMHHFGATGVDPQADPDGDGLTNLEEFSIGGDPNAAASATSAASLGLKVFSPR